MHHIQSNSSETIAEPRTGRQNNFMSYSNPAFDARAVEWLVLANKVNLEDLVAALRQYGMPAAGRP